MTDRKHLTLQNSTQLAAHVRVLDRDVHFEIEQFLFREAMILDRRDYSGWKELLSASIRYRVAARVIREAGAGSQDNVIIDDSADTLARRIDQIGDPKLTHAENPPTFTRRFVSNVQVLEGGEPDTFNVTSYILVYRHRLETPVGGLYSGERHDMLRRTDGTVRLEHRLVLLDHATFAGSVSLIF
jgi:3-phenylpropionate/cinnamic acid dioxygenase small subunit